MADPRRSDHVQDHGRRGIGHSSRRRGGGGSILGSKRSAEDVINNNITSEQQQSTSSSSTPCGACKFLRRKCVSGCIFAPHFGTDQGAARFAAVHKVFGASNVSKLLLHIPVNRRNEAVVTISYEAQARLSDPVLGCVSTILTLQQQACLLIPFNTHIIPVFFFYILTTNSQVASLQAELAMIQSQLINSRYAIANAFQNQNNQHQQEQHQVAMIQPTYSNNSTASNNLINISSFTTSNFDLIPDAPPPPPPPHSAGIIDSIHLSEDADQGNHIPCAFPHDILRQR
ncbi:LOB domain-containing protein 20 [Linum perenne]